MLEGVEKTEKSFPLSTKNCFALSASMSRNASGK